MKNYICINDKKIELTEEQVKKIQESCGINKRLSDIPVGETFKIGKYEFIVLEHSKETTAVILKNLLVADKTFGTNNNYANSHIDKLCMDFSEKLKAIVEKKNLIEHTVDLTADDGLKDYGKIKRTVSLLTATLYRRYVEILDKHKTSEWWWLATPFSTEKHNNRIWVKCVSPSGDVCSDYYYDDVGVRPFCILNSNIFVSE